MIGQTTVEVTNEHGFIDFLLVEDGEIVFENEKPITVCPQCMKLVLMNRGQGTLCDSCNHEFEVECDHDMDDLFLAF